MAKRKVGDIISEVNTLLEELEKTANSLPEKVRATNAIKLALHQISPFKKEPVDCVLWVPAGSVTANDYNPNTVAPPEMKLLEISILEDGYTQPVVTFAEDKLREVVDGFHRTRVGKECPAVRRRVNNYLPVVTINQDRQDKGDRIAATIRHNRARGKHRVDGMSQIVIDLKRRNWSDSKIARELGMDPDEVLRLSQISGLTEMFKDHEFSESWEATAISDSDDLNVLQDIPSEVGPVTQNRIVSTKKAKHKTLYDMLLE